jgi:hypothetical protein
MQSSKYLFVSHIQKLKFTIYVEIPVQLNTWKHHFYYISEVLTPLVAEVKGGGAKLLPHVTSCYEYG